MTCPHSVFKRSDLDSQVPEVRTVSEKCKRLENKGRSRLPCNNLRITFQGKEMISRSKIFILALALSILLFTPATFASIDVYFSRVDDPEGAIIEDLDKARKTIDIAMYYFTDRDLANAVIDAHDRGVKVRIYLDKDQEEAKYAKSRYLTNHGIPLRYSSNPYIMHHKFCVIDNDIVITGSYNWTASADKRNNENLLVIHDAKIAQEYSVEFNRLWNNHGNTVRLINSND